MIPGGFTFSDKPFRLAMGFSPAEKGTWLYRDDQFDADIALKKQLLAEHYDAVCQTMPQSRQAQQSVVDLIKAEKGIRSCRIAQPSIIAAALMVQEDLAILQHINGEYVLSAACICFPTRWDLQDKIGRGMDMIHAPVPGYEQQLQKSVNRYFETVKPDRAFLRYNWSLLDSDVLFQPEWWQRARPSIPEINASNVGSKVFFRLERQTLQCLPGTKDILFSIRVFQSSLEETIDTKEEAKALLYSIETMPGDMKEYKSIARFEEPLKQYLTKRAC